MTSVRDRGPRASKRELESSADWHAALLDQFDEACSNVRYHHRPVSLTGPLIVHHSSSTTPRSSRSTTSGIDEQGRLALTRSVALYFNALISARNSLLH